MKDKFIEKCCHFISKYENCDDLKIKKLKYGLEVIFNLLTKTIILFIVSMVLGIWQEYLLLILIYTLIRMYTYGIHAKSTLACWITTTLVYIGGGLLIKYIIIPQTVTIIIWLISLASFAIWAPADTPAKPLIRADKRKKQKIKACLVCFILLVVLIIHPSQIVNNTICYSLFVQSICINPITYWITKTPFANYKLYLKTHGLN